MATATASASPFAIKANSGEGGDFELPPSGMHPAVLVGLIDLGTHTREFGGEKTDQHKLYFCWELTAENDSKGQSFVVGQDYTFSLNKKAKLRGIVEGYLGRSLADGEEFDPMLMVGNPCIVNLKDGVSGSGKKYVEVGGIGKPMKGQTVPPATKEFCIFSLSQINSTIDPIDIPSWVPPIYGRAILEEIKKSHEYGRLPGF